MVFKENVLTILKPMIADSFSVSRIPYFNYESYRFAPIVPPLLNSLAKGVSALDKGMHPHIGYLGPAVGLEPIKIICQSLCPA